MNVEKKIKILEISGGLSTEGIGVFLLNTFENIDKDRFQLDFALATKYEQVFEERIKQQGGKIYRTFEIGEGIKGKIKHAINLYKLLNREKYDVVHSHMDFFNGFNLFIVFLAGVPLRISHAHIANNSQLSLIQKIYYALMKIFIRLFSNKGLGCSDEANEFINGKGKVIYNGVDVDKFQKKDYCFPNDIRFDKDYKNLITVGRIDNQKNPLYIVEIIYFLSKIRKDFHFYWIGTGSLYNEVKKKINELKIEDKITCDGKSQHDHQSRRQRYKHHPIARGQKARTLHRLGIDKPNEARDGEQRKRNRVGNPVGGNAQRAVHTVRKRPDHIE